MCISVCVECMYDQRNEFDFFNGCEILAINTICLSIKVNIQGTQLAKHEKKNRIGEVVFLAHPLSYWVLRKL